MVISLRPTGAGLLSMYPRQLGCHWHNYQWLILSSEPELLHYVEFPNLELTHNVIKKKLEWYTFFIILCHILKIHVAFSKYAHIYKHFCFCVCFMIFSMFMGTFVRT